MINKNNIEDVINHNQQILDEIKGLVNKTFDKGLQFKYKPLESINNYLMENTEVFLFPSKSESYGGMVLYRNDTYYIHINTLQPKTYENFVWAHEYYHFEYDKDRIKDDEDVTFVNNPVLNENERKANLFASELLINSDVLNALFKIIKKNYLNDELSLNVIRLIPIFKLPYKTIVIKLAQDSLITIKEAIDIIDFDYKNNLPKDFDLSMLEPSRAIRIDGLTSLLESESVKNNMLYSDYKSIKTLTEKYLEQLERLREIKMKN